MLDSLESNNDQKYSRDNNNNTPWDNSLLSYNYYYFYMYVSYLHVSNWHFIHLFLEYLLNIDYMSHIVLDPGTQK